ncbi:MAG TPA: hypothetical protein VGE63_03570 [Candidatus Paceibacterota bacterium]
MKYKLIGGGMVHSCHIARPSSDFNEKVKYLEINQQGVIGSKYIGDERSIGIREMASLGAMGLSKNMRIKNMRKVTAMFMSDWVDIAKQAGIVSNGNRVSFCLEKEKENPGFETCIPIDFMAGASGENLVLMLHENYTYMVTRESLLTSFSNVPIGTIVVFKKEGEKVPTASLVVTAPNTPCHIPNTEIYERFKRNTTLEVDKSNFDFNRLAQGKRGLLFEPFTSGTIKPGQSFEIWIPDTLP